MAPKMEVDGKAIPLTENDAKKFIKGQLQLIKIYSWLVNSFLSVCGLIFLLFCIKSG